MLGLKLPSQFESKFSLLIIQLKRNEKTHIFVKSPGGKGKKKFINIIRIEVKDLRFPGSLKPKCIVALKNPQSRASQFFSLKMVSPVMELFYLFLKTYFHYFSTIFEQE